MGELWWDAGCMGWLWMPREGHWWVVTCAGYKWVSMWGWGVHRWTGGCMGELCGICECMKVRYILHVVVWWCGGRVWAVRKVWVACSCHGGHGVHVDYLWVVYVLWGRCGLHVVAMVAMGCMWTTYGLCMGYIYKYVVVVFMIIDPYKFMVGYCSKILHKVRLSTRPIPLTASCFIPQEKWHPNPKTKSFPFVSLPTNYNFAFTIQYLFEFCFHFYNACKKFLSTYLTPTVQI